MFSQCMNLGQLNAERIKMAQTHDITEVNNAYNKRRTEILSTRINYTKVKPVFVTVEQPTSFCGVPVCGRCPKPNTIQLTPKGFLF